MVHPAEAVRLVGAAPRPVAAGRRAPAVAPLVALFLTAALVSESAGQPAAERLIVQRLPQNPLVTVRSSPSLGGNVNGPTVVRVPAWVERPLGRYYMYFANHMGDSIRLAYADQVGGPWSIYEGGVLQVRDTAFYREPPDPPGARADFYTHVASPEIYVDTARQRLVLWAHGWWTRGERWPPALRDAHAWAREKGYAQFTQVSDSADGLHFTVHPAITRTSYLRVFRRGDTFYGVSRAGLLSRSRDPLTPFDTGPNLFAGTAYAGRVRHVAVSDAGDRLRVFFTAIGDAPERVLMATVDASSDWTTWRAARIDEVLAPATGYECVDLPDAPSESGDIDVPARQIRDPFVFEDAGKVYLFYSTCGEQGIAAAEVIIR